MSSNIKGKNILYTFLSIVILLLFVPFLISAIIPQLSIILFSRNYTDFNIIRILALAIMLIIIPLSERRFYLSGLLNFSLLTFFIYIIYLLVVNIGSYDFSYLYNGYMAFYYLFFILFLANINLPILKYKITLNTLTFLLIISSIMGILQYLLNIPILTVKDSQTNFEVLSWMFYETVPPHVRAFSFFNSSLEFGTFLIFFSGIALYSLLKNRFLWFFILMLIIVATIFTITRNIYIGLLISMISVVVYRFINKSHWLLLLPFFSLILGIMSSGGLGIVSDNGVTSGNTLNVRNYYWQREIRRQQNITTIEFLFGDGRYQSGGELAGSLLFVDNTYLQLLAQIGLVGCIIYLWLYYLILRNIIARRHNALNAGLYGFLVAWPAMAMFNILISQIALYSLVIFLTNDPKPISGTSVEIKK